MDYTSWGRRTTVDGRTEMPLFVEDGPEEIGRFVVDEEIASSAIVDGVAWRTEFHPDRGATATLPDGTVYRASGDFTRGKEIDVRLGDRRFTLLNEKRNDWVVDDGNSVKVAQFSGANQGVRRAILEFDREPGATELTVAETAALSWFARLLLEARLGSSSKTLILILALATVVAILAFIF